MPSFFVPLSTLEFLICAHRSYFSFLLSIFKQKPLTTNKIRFIFLRSYYEALCAPFLPLSQLPTPYLHKIYLILWSSVSLMLLYASS